MSSSSSESIREQIDFPSWRFATQNAFRLPPQYQRLMEENEGKTILVRLAIIEGRTSRKLVPLVKDVAGFVGEDFMSTLDSSEIELEYWSLDT